MFVIVSIASIPFLIIGYLLKVKYFQFFSFITSLIIVSYISITGSIITHEKKESEHFNKILESEEVANAFSKSMSEFKKNVGQKQNQKTDFDNNIEQLLVHTSNELNKSLPRPLDKITILKSTVSIGKKIIYFYEINDQNLNNLQKKDLELIMLNIKEYAMNGFKTNDKHLFFRENRVEIEYSYVDQNGNHLFDFSFIAGDSYE